MESFNIFPDLPSIEESNQAMGDQTPIYNGHWYAQDRTAMRPLNVYDPKVNLAMESRRWPAFPSPFGMAGITYSRGPWHPPYQKAQVWPSAYDYQTIKPEGTMPWTAPVPSPGHLSLMSSFSDSRSNSDDGSNTRSHSWSPVSTRYEKEEEYYASPEGNHEYFSCGGYTQNGIYPSPTFSNASILGKSTVAQGIKLEDVQTYPDTYSEDQFNDFGNKSQQSDSWEPAEFNRTATEDSTMDTRTPVTASTASEDAAVLEDTATDYDENDNDCASDYAPKARSLPRTDKSSKASKLSGRVRPKMKTRSKPSRVSKRAPTKETAAAEAMIALGSGKNVCPHCAQICSSKSSLNKHITTAHTRPFTCTFRKYGCPATFGSKNEWKRHVSSQHLRLGIWRCDIGACYPQHTGHEDEELIFNDFNRKDLFTQHLRRMHSTPNSGSSSDKAAFDASIDEATHRCLVDIRAPPPRTTCGYCISEGQNTVFEGQGGWEARMEHVGRHLESGHGEEREWIEDLELRDWMISEGLLEGNDYLGCRLTGPAYVNAKGR
ncbi:MAG: hypothetical protein MMC23_002877 [Stictis urceolatum]|nr:hypothetical protein [Stictis urceolata]